jgi:hypothetical protein
MQEPGDGENENPGDQSDQRLQHDQTNGHRPTPFVSHGPWP